MTDVLFRHVAALLATDYLIEIERLREMSVGEKLARLDAPTGAVRAVMRLMTALGRLSDLETVLTASTPASLDAMELPLRKRGRSSTLRVARDTPALERPKRG